MYNLTIGVERLTPDAVVELYNNVGWDAYTKDPKTLYKAIQNSTYVVTIIKDEMIISLARCMSDDVSINYLQDILVHTEYQQKGVGRKLLENCRKRFAHVRTHLLLTDNEEKQARFYESLGYTNTKDLEKIVLNCFVQMKGLKLS